jgi:hypothetical protein
MLGSTSRSASYGIAHSGTIKMAADIKRGRVLGLWP